MEIFSLPLQPAAAIYSNVCRVSVLRQRRRWPDTCAPCAIIPDKYHAYNIIGLLIVVKRRRRIYTCRTIAYETPRRRSEIKDVAQGRIQKMNLEGPIQGVTSGVQWWRPGRGSGGRSPPEADDFSHLKGYLDATSGILGGGMAPWPPPLKSATDVA